MRTLQLRVGRAGVASDPTRRFLSLAVEDDAGNQLLVSMTPREARWLRAELGIAMAECECLRHSTPEDK